MRIEVVGRHVTVTEAIRQHAEAKAEKLPKVYDGVQQITVTLEEVGHSPTVFRAEVVLDVVKHETIVAHADGDDLYLAIDAAVEKANRQLRDFKEKLRIK